MTDVTRILNLIESGDSASADELLPVVYSELRQMAAAKMARDRPGQTLDATGLVHEAYFRLVGNQTFECRRHFFKAASEAMRRILIDRARARQAAKRGGNFAQAEISPDELTDDKTEDDRIVDLSHALEEFEQIEPERAELVKLRYFVGLKIHEAAEVLGVSTATADRHWAYAKAWLQNKMAQ